MGNFCQQVLKSLGSYMQVFTVWHSIILKGVIERSYMTVLFNIGPKAHYFYWEAVDVGNKVISQNNIQEIANIVILQRVVLFIKLVS